MQGAVIIRRIFLAATSLACLPYALSVSPALAQSTAAQQTVDDLSTASMENLTGMEVTVSSFARKDEDLWNTPAAVFVITRDDIERSAATSIPELLRMVPGMQVAQISASTWAVSARGFNSEYADKLLVLIDGRTVYSEIYSGAHWDQNDLPLEEIERIEVIRGPGAAVWGTNAVNGVVNVITKRARSTVGTTASAQVGRIDEKTYIKYGGPLGDRIQYRGYATYTNREPLETADGKRAFDGEGALRGGGRLDWQRSHADWITLNGDFYGGNRKQQISVNSDLPGVTGGRDSGSIGGGHLLSRWEHKFLRADTALQVYFDDSSRHELALRLRTRTLDADFQHHLALGSKNDVVLGAEFRLTANRVDANFPQTFKPGYRNYLVDAFAQDEISLVPHRLVLTLGSKLQNGTLAGVQVQPSGRLLWSPNNSQSFWAAVSRAAATPSIQEKDLPTTFGVGVPTWPGSAPLPLFVTLQGNPDVKPPTVLAYEAGYRRIIGSHLTLDLASFFNVNHRMLGISISNPIFVPFPTPRLYSQLLYVNGYRAKTAGVEAAVSWKPVTSLSLQASFAWMQSHVTQSIAGNLSTVTPWSTPRNNLSLSPVWSFAPKWSVSAFLYYVEKTRIADFTAGSASEVPQFTRLDMHLVRKVGRSVELDAGATNLLTPRHVEFGSGRDVISPAYVPRALFIKARWMFP